jgi:O-antigen/teichoic acid export membrane protein
VSCRPSGRRPSGLKRGTAIRPRSTQLVAIAIAGQLAAFAFALLMARRLSVTAFEAWAVAASAYLLLVSLAPLGSEKFALRLLPPRFDRGDRACVAAYLGFAGRRTLVVAVAAAAVLAAFALAARDGEVARALIATGLALPAGALAHVGLEVLSAAGRPVLALVLVRLLVPGLALGLALVALGLGVPVTGARAIGFWGFGWVVTLALTVAALRPWLPPRRPAPDIARDWAREARPFLVYRAALALLAQSGVLALERLGPPGSVGAYAAAMSVATLAAVFATATNRAYGRDLALLLERQESAGIAALYRARLRWLAPVLALFLGLVLLFPAPILTAFRPEFVAAGTAPLRILAVTTAFTVLFALAPTVLKFRRQRRTTYAVVAGAAVVQGLLLLVLVPRWGATGAALAHAAAMTGLYATFAWLGREASLPAAG